MRTTSTPLRQRDTGFVLAPRQKGPGRGQVSARCARAGAAAGGGGAHDCAQRAALFAGDGCRRTVDGDAYLMGACEAAAPARWAAAAAAREHFAHSARGRVSVHGSDKDSRQCKEGSVHSRTVGGATINAADGVASTASAARVEHICREVITRAQGSPFHLVCRSATRCRGTRHRYHAPQ